jgi:hypothetical protein
MVAPPPQTRTPTPVPVPVRTDPDHNEVRATGVRFKTSRAVGLSWAGANVLAAVVTASIADPVAGAPGAVRLAAFIAFLAFAVAAIRLLVGVARSPLTLDVGPDGITLSNGTQSRRVPWYAIARVKVDPHHARPWLMVWLVGAAQTPATLGRGSFSRHKGGLRVYPISHERYRKRRDRDVVELRSALAWYGSAVYDPR